MKRFLAILLSVVVFWACSKDESTSSAPLANSITYNPTNVFVKTVSDVFLVPTAKYPEGTYTITPTLPEGLWFNAQSGAIAGIPQVVSPITTYTVTLTNSSGSVSTSFTITVNDKAPTLLSYTSQNNNIFTAGYSVVNLSPVLMVSSTPVISYSVSPALPAGLSLNPQTGVISGTPTAATPATSYTITATNSGGTSSETISITVNPFYGRIKRISFWDATQTHQLRYINYSYTDGLFSFIYEFGGNPKEYYYTSNRLTRSNVSSSNQHSSMTIASTNYYYTGDLITKDTVRQLGAGSIFNQYNYQNGKLVVKQRTYAGTQGISQTIYNYEYHPDGNLYTVTLSTNSTPLTIYPSYDTKNNPFRYGGFTAEYLALEAVPYNNPLSEGTTTYSYDYNIDNYPIKRYSYDSSGVLFEIAIYEYE
ncbi:MAG: Ig domain-containing protein [Flavobacteriaceae bacterium]